MSFVTATWNRMAGGNFLVEMALNQVPGRAKHEVQRISRRITPTGVITDSITLTHECIQFI